MADSPQPVPVSFPEFQPLTTAQWQARLTRDLKGQDPATLRWPTPDGFAVEPFYHQEALGQLGGAPAPLLRPAGTWRNVPTYAVPAASRGHEAIDRAATALQLGAEGAHFVLAQADEFDVDYLAQQLPLADIYVGYSLRRGAAGLLARLTDTGAGPLRGFLVLDPITHHVPDLVTQQQELREVLAASRNWPEFRALGLDVAYYGNRGATTSQQIAFALSTAAAYLNTLPSDELSVADVAAALHLHVAVAPNYFFEIAKLRALRRLWATLLHAYGLPNEAAGRLTIFASTATWSQTTLDPHTNLLRHATEAMSAVLGGADAVSVGTFDGLFNEPNEFAERLARNLPVLLREEAHLGQVQDPAAGSYYLETLTDTLAREAWALFQQLEAAGGLPAATGRVLALLHEAAQAQFRRIATGEQVVIGTNRYQNAQEQFDFNPKRLLRSPGFDSTRATYPTEVLRLATALHFERRELKKKRAALVLLGAHTNEIILESFLQTLPALERPELHHAHPEGTLSVLFSSAEQATLMYATPTQFGRLARTVSGVPLDEEGYVPPTLLTADLATMQEAVQVFGLKEFTVEGYSTEDVLARLQGKPIKS
ncbi:methylmalonyl-CoA mutase family protein [Hymenobacter actinosclerus]|uniref:Heterodimeric methylmalonyl-CoA mutase small subunit n=1 Tax=Hymenobacter actinosclerus TaxID=82805 RepID=A0A1I0AQZ2_9BACT|nr:methylmalonyl-CoA mutase family protein [Hymenobacter actinosclerus]SES95886.1 heterodimeric methylmalonyl-CoA mutase small subunit [Hymenobacter actinosclerus]